MAKDGEPLSIVVVGASGDLARKKVFPALFALYCQGFLPERFRIFGFARSEFDDTEFRRRIEEHLTCRYAPGESCAARMEEFLARCYYVSGKYGSTDSFLDLFTRMRDVEESRRTNRFYYLAIPPSVFLDVAHAIGNAGLISCSKDEPWSHVVVEKPFGNDRQSSDELVKAMSQVFVESQTYRIDHYLGKEVIQNLLVLRFANMVFERLWNRDFIQSVRIIWKEDLSLDGRGGYFDQYGIIRDVMQNHLLQILALVTMEPPERFAAETIAHQKAHLLKSIPPVQLDDLVIGQYVQGERNGRVVPGYLEDPMVPDDSISPTYAAVRLYIDSPRWQGVPISIEAGKGLDARMTEIRILFREVPGSVFAQRDDRPKPNELIIRVQPDEAIHLWVTSKVPGMNMRLDHRTLDLQYKTTFDEPIPDAYESLLLDVIRGDRSLFIRKDELQASWDIFTPVLHELETRRIVPESYPFGSTGPESAKAILG
ncbi:MAG: glucose-6-phosphate dehydrogenase [Sedimentisphaerales bacterium]|nr:glucose-6-phosphate dehydrogenase [Sedimentisphaerales bacterium]